MKLSEHVQLLGERNDIPDLLAGAGFFVSSSLTEGVSLTLLEAMAVGNEAEQGVSLDALFRRETLRGLSGVIARIPMVALAAVMMVVAVSTVNWHSVRPATLRRMPVPETLVMALTECVERHARHEAAHLLRMAHR